MCSNVRMSTDSTFTVNRYELVAEGALAAERLRSHLLALGFHGWTEQYATGYWQGEPGPVFVFTVYAQPGHIRPDGRWSYEQTPVALKRALREAHGGDLARGEVFQFVDHGPVTLEEV